MPEQIGRTAKLHSPAAWPRLTLGVLEVVVVGLLATYLVTFALQRAPFQGDLRTYLYAAKAAVTGLDPYSRIALQQVGGRPVMPWVYPPIALLPFIALASAPTPPVLQAWLIGKVVLLLLLVVVWWRRWLPRTSLTALALIAVFGANRTAMWDLGSGNLALFEAALLWLAFDLYVHGHRRAFTVLVIAASVCKLTPIVFLLLLLVPTVDGPWRPRLLLGGGSALAALVLLPLLIPPASQWQHFWTAVPDATTYGDSNPSSLGLLTMAAQSAGLSPTLAVWAGRTAWLGFALALLIHASNFLRRLVRQRDLPALVMSLVLLYVLLHPRIMAYGYVLAVPAWLYFAPRPFDSRVGALGLALLFSTQGISQLLTSNYSDSLLVRYSPFVLTLSVWLLSVSRYRTARADSPEDRHGHGGDTRTTSDPALERVVA